LAGIDNELGDRLAEELRHRPAEHLVRHVEGEQVDHFAGELGHLRGRVFRLRLAHHGGAGVGESGHRPDSTGIEMGVEWWGRTSASEKMVAHTGKNTCATIQVRIPVPPDCYSPPFSSGLVGGGPASPPMAVALCIPLIIMSWSCSLVSFTSSLSPFTSGVIALIHSPSGPIIMAAAGFCCPCFLAASAALSK